MSVTCPGRPEYPTVRVEMLADTAGLSFWAVGLDAVTRLREPMTVGGVGDAVNGGSVGSAVVRGGDVLAFGVALEVGVTVGVAVEVGSSVGDTIGVALTWLVGVADEVTTETTVLVLATGITGVAVAGATDVDTAVMDGTADATGVGVEVGD